MAKSWYGVLAATSLVSIAASLPASAGTQLCPGPTLSSPYLAGSINNGSTCNLEATSSTVTELYIGANAADEDVLSLGPTAIFDNMTTTSGTTASQTETPGSTLPYTVSNLDDPVVEFLGIGNGVYATGTAYTNAVSPFLSLFGVNSTALYPVYHFAFFDFSSAADFNSVFGSFANTSITPGGSVDEYILGNGGYSDWTFVGVEDSQVDSSDDWNDVIYAFRDVAPAGTVIGGGGTPTIPEPSTWAMMVLGFVGLGFAGFRRKRSAASVA